MDWGWDVRDMIGEEEWRAGSLANHPATRAAAATGGGDVARTHLSAGLFAWAVRRVQSETPAPDWRGASASAGRED